MKILFYLAFNVLLYCILSCSSVQHHYEYDTKYVPTDFPKFIYLNDQISVLNTRGTIQEDKRPFCEIRQKDGKKHMGKLVKIAETYVQISFGYNLREKNYKQTKVDKYMEIPKSEILILKIW